jgi:hypothetical protein
MDPHLVALVLDRLALVPGLKLPDDEPGRLDVMRRVLSVPAMRRRVTRDDPLLFALVYLGRHLKGGPEHDGPVTFAEAHLEWASMAEAWTRPHDGEVGPRDAIIAPRETGKSTWWFLILPMWGAAHGHVKFAAAFADSATQAETHLQSFKGELETNAAIREDFPDLTTPKTRGRGVTAADRVGMYQAASGFVFAARGIDSATLGLKVGEKRPDLMILDDIEPDEARYSSDSMKKRLGTLQDAILPLAMSARVVLVGTVTMAGSIVHQLSKHALGKGTEEWITAERFRARHHMPILRNDDGTERSMWPERWSLAWMNTVRRTRAFAKNYLNDPKGANGDYWTADDFIIGKLDGVTRVLVSVDPAVTSKETSDDTGLAVVGYSPSEKKVEVRKAYGVKLSPEALRRHVLKMIEEDPSIGLVLVEVNQGGDVWRSIFHDMPVPVVTRWQGVSKEIRAARALTDYQRKRVVHWEGLTTAEEQMVGFPKAPHDDIVDAVGTGTNFFLHRPKKKRAAGTSASYV